MYFQLAEILHKVIDHARLRHEMRFAYQFLPFEFSFGLPLRHLAGTGGFTYINIWKEVAGIKNAAYIILRIAKYRKARIALFNHHLHNFGKSHVEIQPHDVDTWCHDFRCRGVAEFQNPFKHSFILTPLDIGYFKCLPEFVGRNVTALTRHHTVHDFGGMHQYRRYRVKQLDEEIQTRCGEPRPCHGLRIGHKLRQNLAEQENQECKYYGLQQEIKPSGHQGKQVRQSKRHQHHNRDIDKVVGDKDGCEQPLRHGYQTPYGLGTRRLVKLLSLLRRD